MTGNNGITVSVYNVYKIGAEFFLSLAGIDFSTRFSWYLYSPGDYK